MGKQKRNKPAPEEQFHEHEKALVDLEKVARSGGEDASLSRQLIRQIMTKPRLSIREWNLIKAVRERQQAIINR